MDQDATNVYLDTTTIRIVSRVIVPLLVAFQQFAMLPVNAHVWQALPENSAPNAVQATMHTQSVCVSVVICMSCPVYIRPVFH